MSESKSEQTSRIGESFGAYLLPPELREKLTEERMQAARWARTDNERELRRWVADKACSLTPHGYDFETVAEQILAFIKAGDPA